MVTWPHPQYKLIHVIKVFGEVMDKNFVGDAMDKTFDAITFISKYLYFQKT